jgi:hypothetical protein
MVDPLAPSEWGTAGCRPWEGARCDTTHTVMSGYPDMTLSHCRLCSGADGIVISGDLHEDLEQAVRQLERWEQAGITHARPAAG